MMGSFTAPEVGKFLRVARIINLIPQSVTAYLAQLLNASCYNTLTVQVVN